MVITSVAHTIVKDIRNWRKSKAKLPVEGSHYIREALEAGFTPFVMIVRSGLEEEYADFLSRSDRCLTVDARVMDRISALHSPPGIMAVFSPPDPGADLMNNSAGPLILLADIQDPGNAGLIIRSARAFGAAGVITLEKTCRLWQEKVVRSSAGHIFRVPISEHLSIPECNDLFGTRSVWILDSRESGILPAELTHEKDPVLVVGNEGHGFRSNTLTNRGTLRIPMQGGTDSLNAAMALTCVLYELYSLREGGNS